MEYNPEAIPVSRHETASDHQELVAESCWPGQSLAGPGWPGLCHLSTFWESGKWEEDPLGEKTTVSDTGNAGSPGDLRIPEYVGALSLPSLQPPRPCGETSSENTGLVFFWKEFHSPLSCLPTRHFRATVDFWGALTYGPRRRGGVVSRLSPGAEC